jgi:hypothetical protein
MDRQQKESCGHYLIYSLFYVQKIDGLVLVSKLESVLLKMKAERRAA